MRRCLAFLLVASSLLAAPPIARTDDFAIRDGDTVAFLGDSITAERTYGKIIENYTFLRFPDRKVRFINVGIGGDTAAGGLKRLERDVFANKVTLLTVAFGVNDIGWGMYADDAHRQLYLDSIRGIVEACKQRGVRVYICSAAATAGDPAKSENGYLKKMCDEGMAIARELGEHSIDVQGFMRDVQKKFWKRNASITDAEQRTSLHVKDGVHLNELGQLAMAVAILKGLGAPADVSSAVLDADGPKLVEAKGCTISDLAADGDALKFTRLDEGLPFNWDIFYSLNYLWVPVPQLLNQYLLTVKGLPKGRYEVLADGRSAGTFTAAELAAGANISWTTPDAWQPGGPWNAQANLLRNLTEARYEVLTAKNQAPQLLPESPANAELATQADAFDAQIVAMQRSMARPQPYHFVVKPAAAPPEKKPAP